MSKSRQAVTSHKTKVTFVVCVPPLPTPRVWPFHLSSLYPSLKIPFAKHRRAGCTSGRSQVWVQSWRKRVRSGPPHSSPAAKPGNQTGEQYPENSGRTSSPQHPILKIRQVLVTWRCMSLACIFAIHLHGNQRDANRIRNQNTLGVPKWPVKNKRKWTDFRLWFQKNCKQKHGIFMSISISTSFAWTLTCRSFSQLCAAGSSKTKR